MTSPGSAPRARVVVVMGVSGSGKTAVGTTLADRLGWRFIEGDDLHPPENVAKMRAGEPLTDEDRAPWLDAVGRAIDAAIETEAGVVVACSALRRAYREALRRRRPGMRFVHLDVPAPVLRRRMRDRDHAFMPSSLLDSQLATLEPLGPDEAGVIVDGSLPLAEVVDAAIGGA